MATRTYEMQIALDGVIDLLARSLYASPDVFVRELVQNAHDAIVKRRLAEGEEFSLRPGGLRPSSGPPTRAAPWTPQREPASDLAGDLGHVPVDSAYPHVELGSGARPGRRGSPEGGGAPLGQMEFARGTPCHDGSDPDRNASRSELGSGARPGSGEFAGRITIRPDGDALVFEDDGIGLREDELHTYLSTIGRSGTREVRQGLRTHADVVTLIGQFGIGLLSAFIVATEVTVETRAAGQPAWRWASHGGRGYTVEPGARDAVGSTVRVVLRPNHRQYLQPAVVRRIVRRHADLLRVPVFVAGDPTPTNRGVAPWDESAASPAAAHALASGWWHRRFGDRPALVTRFDTTFDHDGRPVRLAGLIGFPGVERAGEVELDVYVASMFVTARQRQLLPDWAGPVGGAIGCDALTPNAARDDVMGDPVRDRVQERMSEILSDWVTTAARTDRDALVHAIRLHASRLLPFLAALPDDVLSDLAPVIPLRTDGGPRLLGELLAESPTADDGVTEIHAFGDWAAANQFLLVCRARRIPAVDLSETAAADLLDRWAPLVGARVVRIDVAGLSRLFDPLPAEEAFRYRGLVTVAAQVLAGRQVSVEPCRFAPATVPALRVDTPGGRHRRVLSALADDGAVPADLRELLGAMEPAPTPDAALYLNVEHPIVQRLAARAVPGDPRVEAAIRLLYAGAALLSGQRTSAAELERLFADTTAALELLIP